MQKYIKIWLPGGCCVAMTKGEILTALKNNPELWERALSRGKMFKRRQRAEIDSLR